MKEITMTVIVHLDLPARLALLDRPDLKELLVLLEPLANLESQDLKVTLAILVLQVLLDRRANKDLRETALASLAQSS
jgi:hypothetical protein